MELTTTTIQAICALVTDGTHDSPKLLPTGIPFIKGKHISSGKIDFATCDFISETDHLACIKRVRPQRDDVLFSNIGSVGDTARVDSDIEFSIKNVALFRPDTKKIDPRYFYYLVINPAFKQALLATRSGSAQPFITLGNLRPFCITHHADRTVQSRIASILSAYDDLIENNTRRIAILEEMARRLYEEWFVHFRFPGHEQVRMVESELGLIPEGWGVEKVGEVLQRLPSGTTYKKEQVQEIGSVIVVDQSTADHLGFHDAVPDHLASVDTPIGNRIKPASQLPSCLR